MPKKDNSPLDLFKEIDSAYRPSEDDFDPDSYIDFIKQHELFIHEFDFEAVKKACKDADANSPYLLVVGDLSGIQDTVYTISSKGALKTLRARSFMLELLCEHICYEVLTHALEQDYGDARKHIVFSGGGLFFLILPNTESIKKDLDRFREELNDWAFEQFTGKLFVAITMVEASEARLSNEAFAETWEGLGDELDRLKKRRFSHKLDHIFSSQFVKEPIQTRNEDECAVCHRDDVKERTEEYSDSPDKACPMCKCLFFFGDELTEFKYIHRRSTKPAGFRFLTLRTLDDSEVYYTVSSDDDNSTCWKINAQDQDEHVPFLFANYVRKVSDLPESAQKAEQENHKKEYGEELTDLTGKTATFSGLAETAYGANFIGALRMDVDNLGKIFTKGLGEHFTLENLARLSSLLNLFFKVFLNQICESKIDEIMRPVDITDKGYSEKGRNVSVIYSGGDDLFIVGAWDEIAELSLDIQRCFAKYSGLGISGGVTLHKPKFPLYQIARLSGEAEKVAKTEDGDEKNRVALFYDLNKRVRRDAIIENLKAKVSGMPGDRYRLAIRWHEFNDFVLPLTNQLKNLGKLKDRRIVIDKLPASAVEKFFQAIEEWQLNGQIYLPAMARILEQTKKNMDKTQFAELLKYLYSFNPENIKKLHIPLIWFSYLRR